MSLPSNEVWDVISKGFTKVFNITRVVRIIFRIHAEVAHGLTSAETQNLDLRVLKCILFHRIKSGGGRPPFSKLSTERYMFSTL